MSLDKNLSLVATNAIPPVSIGKKVYRLGVTSVKPFTLTAVFGGQLKPKTAFEISLNDGYFTYTVGDIPLSDLEVLKDTWFSFVGMTNDGDKIYSLSDFVHWTNSNLCPPYALIALVLLRDFVKRDDSTGDEFSRDQAQRIEPESVTSAIIKAYDLGLNFDLIKRKFPVSLAQAVDVHRQAKLKPASEVKPEDQPQTEDNADPQIETEDQAIVGKSEAFKTAYKQLSDLLDQAMADPSKLVNWTDSEVVNAVSGLNKKEKEAIKKLFLL